MFVHRYVLLPFNKACFGHLKLVHLCLGSCQDASPVGPGDITIHSYSIVWFHIICKRLPHVFLELSGWQSDAKTGTSPSHCPC
jgi:hypothetical protein